ncbi:probable inactive receptor kinase [Tanacetum coccineum]
MGGDPYGVEKLVAFMGMMVLFGRGMASSSRAGRGVGVWNNSIKAGRLAFGFVYLQPNRFYGPLPMNIKYWNNLSILDLSNNGFSSPSIANMSHLTGFNLANNSFSGKIPDLSIPSLQVLDKSNNNLTRPVPKCLKKVPGSTFVGNGISPLRPTPPVVSPRSQPSNKSLKLIEHLLRDKKKVLDAPQEEKVTKMQSGSQNVNGNGNFVFFKGSSLVFDLEDLFRVSDEVLSKGTFGTTYKATLEDASTVVVKRFKEVAATKGDFELQMELVGSIRHENVVYGLFYQVFFFF